MLNGGTEFSWKVDQNKQLVSCFYRRIYFNVSTFTDCYPSLSVRPEWPATGPEHKSVAVAVAVAVGQARSVLAVHRPVFKDTSVAPLTLFPPRWSTGKEGTWVTWWFACKDPRASYKTQKPQRDSHSVRVNRIYSVASYRKLGESDSEIWGPYTCDYGIWHRVFW